MSVLHVTSQSLINPAIDATHVPAIHADVKWQPDHSSKLCRNQCQRGALTVHAMDRSAHQRFCFRRISRPRLILAERPSELIDRPAKRFRIRNVAQEAETPFVLNERTGDKIIRKTAD
jgi:hypothetical protein